jgi:hypothetical protein
VCSGWILSILVVLLDFQSFFCKLQRGIKLTPMAKVATKVVERRRSQRYTALKVRYVVTLRYHIGLFQELKRRRKMPRVQALNTPNVAPHYVALDRGQEVRVRVTTTLPSQIDSLLVALGRADEFMLSCVGTCLQLESFDC